jgi:hypothetical protein
LAIALVRDAEVFLFALWTLAPGERLRIRLPGNRVSLFDAGSGARL